MDAEAITAHNAPHIEKFTEYRAHKTVKAARLFDFYEDVNDLGTWALIVALDPKTFVELRADSDWVYAHNIDDRGYVVVGADGQLAFSRAEDFEPLYVDDAQDVADGVKSTEHKFERNALGELQPIGTVNVPPKPGEMVDEANVVDGFEEPPQP